MSSVVVRWTFVGAISVLTAGPVIAQGSQHDEQPEIFGVRTSVPPHLDGVLDEAAWETATPATTFIQVRPNEGAASSQQTVARVLFDGEALYVGLRMHDSGSVTRRLGRRDMPLGDSDWVTVVIDSYHDHQTAYGFSINPSGVRGDQARAGDGADKSWDPVWSAATTIDEGGWTAEMKIPFSQLRYSTSGRSNAQGDSTPSMIWGLQIERIIGRENELAVFAFTPSSERGGIAKYGHLAGLAGIGASRKMEVLPYVVAKGEYVDRQANPFRNDADGRATMGLDMKYRLTSDITLDATINPDFGQVEVDPAVVNLSAFETFYQERRPFFVEGSSIFDFGSGSIGPGSANRNLFYSRRIGRQPQVNPPPGPSNRPEVTDIIGAAKLTGRTRSGWSVGLLGAATSREDAEVLTADGGTAGWTVEPSTSYLVARAMRQMRRGSSAIGGMATAVRRDLNTTELANALRSDAYAGGIDFRHEWARRTWTFSGFITGSVVQGSEQSLLRTQLSSARYFQRPDAEHLELDAEATSLRGTAGQLQVRRQTGRGWTGDIGVSWASPGYEVNDLGFQSRADQLGLNGRIMRSETQPGRLFRTYQLMATWVGGMNFGQELTQNAVSAGGAFQFLNYWGGSVIMSKSMQAWDDRLTRGGPLAVRPDGGVVSIGMYSDARKPLTVNGGGQYIRDSEGAATRSLNANLGIKTSPRWNLTVGPQLTRQSNPAQYVMSIPDALATETFGRRYVFAEVDQTVLSLNTRFNLTFSPSLTLELFAQPFVAAADFSDYKEFLAPRTYDFAVYGQDRGTIDGRVVDPDGSGPATSFTIPDAGFARDFVLRSLRGNAVLRWEWRPGSTIYVAWQQSRRSDLSNDGLSFRRDLNDLFTGRSDHVLMLKVNYWFNP